MPRLLLLTIALAVVPLLSPAKTKLLVEDPENLVVARFSLNAEQRRDALAAAESLLASDHDRPYADALRYVAVEVGPLTPRQETRQPGQETKARRRLARYDLPVGTRHPVRTVALYDVQRHRILHGRLYAVYDVPRRGEVGRVDDDLALFLGTAGGDGKTVRSK